MDDITQEKLNIPAWITIAEASKLLNIKEKTIKNRCYNGDFTYKIEMKNNLKQILLRSSSLPLNIKKDSDADDKKYSEAPLWAKFQADKYLSVIKSCQNLKGEKLKEFIGQWNDAHSNNKTSYSSIIRMKKRYKKEGINGLLSKYGNNSGRTIIDNQKFEYFKNIYLSEGAPSLQTCWEITLGYFIKNYGIDRIEFPSCSTFKRRLRREVPKQSIYLARYGQSAWNRKYGGYIERDYSNITCGKVWISDHAQIDIACITEDGDVVFPWVTAWRDYKSGKWLGWILQAGHPDSDCIFQSFYYAAEKYGLPADVIIDNGKDYRCKDFAGGRKKLKVETNKEKTTCMLAELNIEVHFALPYNAQTKPIERDFLKIKEMLSKHCVGYRGGNVVERPEKLALEIKKGKVLPFETLKKVFDDFVINILNKKPSQGKNLNGLSPDDLFNAEFKEKVITSKDALKLFCMRTSKNYTVARNGIKDNALGITYWADWMIAKMGLKVYLRRDIENYKEAWAFNAKDDSFVGKISAVRAVAALHADKVSKEEFKEAIAIKKRNLKIAKSYIKQTREISIQEKCENYKAAFASVEKENKPHVSKIANTNMDKAIRKNKEMEAFYKQDLSMFLDETVPQENPLYLFETDKILEEELKGAANGY